MCILYGRCSQDITLQEALNKCASALSDGVAILYSPSSCQFAKMQTDGTLRDFQDTIIDFKDVFEVRIFNKNCELRWLNERNGKGRSVLISESSISTYLSNFIEDLKALDVIRQQYILWGKGVSNTSTSGWGKLVEARIGTLYVPVTGLTPNKRVYLKAVEYIKEVDDNGNVAVVEERLTGLEVK